MHPVLSLLLCEMNVFSGQQRVSSQFSEWVRQKPSSHWNVHGGSSSWMRGTGDALGGMAHRIQCASVVEPAKQHKACVCGG